MKNQTFGPQLPVEQFLDKAEPTPEKKQPKRPISGYGPSLAPKKTLPHHTK